MFYRGVSGGLTCINNQRSMRQAKAEWALERNKMYFDSPGDSELFGPGKYLPAKPRCPLGGTYTIDTLEFHPSCSLAGIVGHTL